MATTNKITVGIPTKNRYESLSHTLISIAFQTLKPEEIIIVDDSDTPKDLRENPQYVYIFKLLEEKGIKWKVLFGKKLGQHHSHQLIQEEAIGNLIFRIDDDCVAEPDTLQRLYESMEEKTGAVAPLVLMPPAQRSKMVGSNKISNLEEPNIQWFKWTGVRECEHLYSCFLYRRNIVKYDLRLSSVAHREETIFTHELFREGYKLIVNSAATVWHFRGETGGIRSHKDISLYEHDEKIFQEKMQEWKVESKPSKWFVLDVGLGDHLMFKKVLPQLKERFKGHILKVAVCYPHVFENDPDITIKSISEAKSVLGESVVDSLNPYKWAWQNNWKKQFSHVYLQIYK